MSVYIKYEMKDNFITNYKHMNVWKKWNKWFQQNLWNLSINRAHYFRNNKAMQAIIVKLCLATWICEQNVMFYNNITTCLLLMGTHVSRVYLSRLCVYCWCQVLAFIKELVKYWLSENIVLSIEVWVAAFLLDYMKMCKCTFHNKKCNIHCRA